MKTVEDVICHNDCRIFRSFLRFGALRGAKAFMNAVLDGLDLAQVNCIHRLRHWCESNNFKRAQSKTVIEQFNFSILSIKEEEKFLRIIGRDDWPSHMDTVKENLLRTTLCDTELAMNSGNGNDALPSIWRSFKRLHPAEARGIEDQSTGDAGSSKTESTEPTNTSDLSSEPPPPPVSENHEQQEMERVRMEQEKIEAELKRKEELRKSGDKCLSDSKITTKKISFDDYITEIWTPSSPRVDLVVSSIPTNEPIEKLKKLPAFCKQVLKTGCYAFFIVNNYQYSILESLFQEEGFKVMDYCFIIVYDTTTMQKRTTSDFPQRNGDIAIVAKMSGIHPNGYTPLFSDKDLEKMSEDYVRYASLINITCCKEKLKKPKQLAALRTDEKSVQLYSHIIKMLSPLNGSVFDPLGGTCTATIACLETNRSCVCLEVDEECYRYALGRARIFATPGASMVDLEDYAEPIDVDILNEKGTTFKNKRRRDSGGDDNLEKRDLTDSKVPVSDDCTAVITSDLKHPNPPKKRRSEIERNAEGTKRDPINERKDN